MYTLEKLVELFRKHAVQAEHMRQTSIQHFKEHSPDEPIPESFLEDFNLPLALQTICSEILKLKGKS
jgi:hypothetical protein